MKWFHVLGGVYTVLFWVAHSTVMYTVTTLWKYLLSPSLEWKLQVAGTSETLVVVYMTSRRRSPKDHKHSLRRR
jgi:hypothetical protein